MTAPTAADTVTGYCHTCDQPVDNHQPGCPASPLARQFRHRRRRRVTKRRDFVIYHGAVAYGGTPERSRKPAHRYGHCHICRKPSGIRRADACRRNDRCRCAGCADLLELAVPDRLRFKARPEQFRGN